MTTTEQIFLFFFIGAGFGIIKYPLINIIDFPIQIARSIISSTYKKYIVSKENSLLRGKIFSKIVSTVFFVLLGLSGILLNYVATDGIFRVYLVIFIILGYKISEYFSSKLFLRMISALYFILELSNKIIFFLMSPVRYIGKNAKISVKMLVKSLNNRKTKRKKL